MKKIFKYLLFSLTAGLTVFMNISFSQAANTFLISTESFSPYFPAYTGNGYFSLSTTLTGTKAAESYMIKLYDHAKDDIPRIACLPAWNEIDYYNGISWLNDPAFDSMQFKDYRQTLDMYNGLVHTRYNWQMQGRQSEISVTEFISRSNKNLAVIRFELTPGFTDSVRLLFPLSQREKPRRMALARLKEIEPDTAGQWPKVWYPGFVNVLKLRAEKMTDGGIINAYSQSEGRNSAVAQAIGVAFDNVNKPIITADEKKTSAMIEIRFRAEKGVKYTFYKYASVASAMTDEGDIEAKAREVCEAGRQTGYEKLLNEHKKTWNRLWNTDIIVEGDGEFQKVIHSMIFYLLSSIGENTGFSIPPMGLSTSGYYGHIFWDADTYMFPPLLFMHPLMARSMVMFRVNALGAAKENALKNNYRGAMYPWESDELGRETTPFFAYQNALKENHIVGDVALAQWQYYLATGDKAWLKEYGSGVIFACADFWVSRVEYNKDKDRYEIGRLVSVSEGLIDVSNETYTNSIAKINLEIALKVSDILKTGRNPEWEKISQKLFIPLDEENQFHPTYENAPPGTTENAGFWSSVAPLLSFPLQMEMSRTVKRNDLVHAVKALEEVGAGAMMGINFLPVIAAELEDDSLFNLTIEKTLRGYLRPPFNVLSETHDNKSINFITGAGAFLQQVIFGYTGLRLTDRGLIEKYKPRLPKNITSLRLKNFTVNNLLYDITVTGGRLSMKPVR